MPVIAAESFDTVIDWRGILPMWLACVPALPRASARDRSIGLLTELDYLMAVDDHSRVGAIRLVDPDGETPGTTRYGDRRTPPLLEVGQILKASRAVELSQETAEDLAYLQGRGTSLGGMRSWVCST